MLKVKLVNSLAVFSVPTRLGQKNIHNEVDLDPMMNQRLYAMCLERYPHSAQKEGYPISQLCLIIYHRTPIHFSSSTYGHG